MRTVEQVIDQVPEPAQLRQRLAALSILARIAGWSYLPFEASKREDQWLFRFEDGAGNELNAVFAADGCFVQGFDHESPLSPFEHDVTVAGLFKGFPGTLVTALVALPAEDQFLAPELEVAVPPTTFCIWWDAQARRWAYGKAEFSSTDPLDSDGASFLLSALTPERRFLEELGWDPEAVERVFERGELDESLVRRLNAKADWAKVAAHAQEIGFLG